MTPPETDRQRETKAAALAHAKGVEEGRTQAKLEELDRGQDHLDTSITVLQGVVDAVRTDVTALKTKLAIYATVGSLIGGGLVTLVYGLAAEGVG